MPDDPREPFKDDFDTLSRMRRVKEGDKEYKRLQQDEALEKLLMSNHQAIASNERVVRALEEFRRWFELRARRAQD